MDKRITRYTSLEAMKADEYRLWQRLPGSERMRAVMELNMRAVMELNMDLYGLKGRGTEAPRLQRTLVRFIRRSS